MEAELLRTTARSAPRRSSPRAWDSVFGELALTVAGIGLGTYGFIADKDTFKGVGIGLAALGAPLLVIDTFNNASAGRYIENLERFQPSLAVGHTHDGGGWRSRRASRRASRAR